MATLPHRIPHRMPASGVGRLAAGLSLAALLLAGAGCSHSAPAPAPAPASDGSATTSLPPPATRFIFGDITAQDGSIWTVKGIKGNTYEVTITDRTIFGTLLNRKSRDLFKVGDRVRVSGDITDTDIRAFVVDFAKRPAAPTK